MLCKIAIVVFWLVLLLAYSFIVNFVPRSIVKLLKNNSKLLDQKNKVSGESTLPLGTIEIFSFALSIVLEIVAFIGVWLGLKTLNRWGLRRKNEGPKEAAEINIFLIGNILSVLMGVFGGLIFRWLSNLWGIADVFIKIN
jgi:amino acid permease